MRYHILLFFLLLNAGCATTTEERAGDADAVQAEIRKSDLILRPSGAGPFPAVIMLHGCRGLGSRDRLLPR